MAKKRENGSQKNVEEKVIEISFGPNKPVELKVGSSLSSIKPERVIKIDEDYEFVFSIDNGIMVTFSYEGPNTIVQKRRSLNQKTLTERLVDCEIYKRKKGPDGIQFDAISTYLKEKDFSYSFYN
jgi:hypothetical protein